MTIEISSETKLQIANILKEHGKQIAIEIGCTLLEEKSGVPKPLCKRAVKALIKKFNK